MFFFGNLKRIHRAYAKFFDSEDEDRETTETDSEDTPSLPPSQSAARFYFDLTYQLAKEDITKMDRLNELPLYLCLNTASLLKDRFIKHQNELKKLEREQRNKAIR